VTATGRLGVLASSERYKTAIAPMGSNTTKLERLRPVTFHLKTDPKGALQYGLIAEEVAKVYPELVIRNESGWIDGVRYDELAPMLLNEMQKRNAAQDVEIRELKQQMADLKNLNQATQVALRKLQAKDELVAQP
jgi:Chaperone of endosialidase